ncbi:hypothetical protein CEXT_234521 [Caerostris extrusa]|uniref:Uncharacterized protein n=1 Tax=Caerostris extrusa TaxID=172846 RepID=A0AAV4MXB2_CAEEX|nr:hypothetical protein CEXT_234521 [Caerostris extrusa]
MNTQRLVEDAAFAIWTFYCTLKSKVKDSKRQQIAIWKLKLIGKLSLYLICCKGREKKNACRLRHSMPEHPCSNNSSKCVVILKWPYFNGIILGPRKISPSSKLQYAAAGRKGLNKNSWAAENLLLGMPSERINKYLAASLVKATSTTKPLIKISIQISDMTPFEEGNFRFPTCLRNNVASKKLPRKVLKLFATIGNGTIASPPDYTPHCEVFVKVSFSRKGRLMRCVLGRNGEFASNASAGL